MNTIAALTRSEPATAEAAIEDLSDLFRAALNTSHGQTTLDEELMLARRYLNIEALRLGSRLVVTWDLEGVPLDVRVPPLILQPLLENAIYHGIEPLPQGGTIRVVGTVDGGSLQFEISNPVPAAARARQSQGHRIAQENIRQRLQIAFGAGANLDTAVTDDNYTVILRMPLAGLT